MELKDVKLILKRIQSYYPSFIIDDFKTKEWYNELKKFEYDDVNRKLEEHMRSADYGTYEPKLFYLTKYLKTKEEKQLKTDYYCSCTMCGKYFKLSEYDKHFDRCSSIEFINKQCMDMKNTEIDKEKYFNMSDEEFTGFYDKLLKIVYNNSKDEMQKNAIRRYFESA